ncbi:hypothetical protein M0812_13764 [Anaeramoeba flamelloides]|uniref:Uncharacterized protein n=1 Tax=Anaeramoeba flamelloides TaxID=1746091 RepID=A0AAV7ZN13_9EUKA|nr:hypothetical protein M0812_13764 [Anaeramoeba flamelloides]
MFKDKDRDTYGIFGQFVNSDGTKQGKEIQVNTIVESFQLDHKLLVLTNDNLLVMWNSFYQDGSSCGVSAKIYSKDGSVVKSDFLINVNDTHLGQLLHSGHNIVPNNQFIITWDSSGKQESGNTIVAQILNNDGTFVGSDFIVNKNNNGNQRIKNVLVLDNGKILFVWECEQEKDYKYVIYNPDTTVYKENKTIVSTKNYENVFLLTPNTLTTVSLPPTSKSTSTPTTKLQPTSPALDTKEDDFNFFIFYQKKAEKTHAKEYKLLGKDGKIIKDWTMVGDFFRAGEFKKIEYQDEMPKTFLLSNNQVTTAYIGEILQPDELTLPNSGNVKHLYNQEHIYGYNLNTKDYSTTEIYHIDDYYKDSDRDSITGCALNDKYVIAYRDKNGNDGDSDGIFGAIFNNKDNSAVKEEFLINGITQGRQYSPKIVRQSGSDENNWGIFYLCEDQNNENAFNLHYRIFDGSGKLIGKTHEMNQDGYDIVDYHFGYINDQENQIFLVYTDNSNKDGDGSGVFGQIIKITDGSKIGKLLSLSKTTKGDQ